MSLPQYDREVLCQVYIPVLNGELSRGAIEGMKQHGVDKTLDQFKQQQKE